MGKIKQFLESDRGKDVLTVLIVILVGLGSFELGRLSKGSKGAGVTVEYASQGANAIYGADTNVPKTVLNTESVEKNFFASNRGSKYYPTTCDAGKSIKMENRVYFATAVAAEAGGYELSSSCK